MKVVSHEGELSTYFNKPLRVMFVSPSLVPVWWRVERFGCENLPVSGLDDLVDSTIYSLSNLFDLIVNKPITWSQGFTGCSSRRFTIQAKCVDTRQFDLAHLSCFLALLGEFTQIFDIVGACCYMVRKLNPDCKTAAVNRPFFKYIGSARLVCENPRFLSPHLGVVLAILADCRAVRRLIVVQPDTKSLVHSDVALELAEATSSKRLFSVYRYVSI